MNNHFIGCSNRADCMQISAPIVGDLLLLEQRGIVAFDALLQKMVKVFAPVLIFIGDNPRASEFVNHMGPTAKKFCRMCLVSWIVALMLLLLFECRLTKTILTVWQN